MIRLPPPMKPVFLKATQYFRRLPGKTALRFPSRALFCGFLLAIAAPLALCTGRSQSEQPGGPAADDAIVLEGSFAYENWLRPAGIGIERDAHGWFRVELRPPWWAIEYEVRSAVTNPAAVFAGGAASSDGRHTFVVRRPNPSSAPQPAAHPPAHPGVIYASLCPPVWEREPYHLWLMLVAPVIWTNAVGPAPGPEADDLALFHDPRAECRYRWVEPTNGGGRQLLIEAPGELLIRWLPRGPHPQLIRFPPPFHRGYPMVQVRWLTETNLGGLRIPLLAELVYLTRNGLPESFSGLEPCHGYTTRVGRVSIRPARSMPIPPPPDTTVLVTDHRFWKAGVAELHYSVRNDWSAAEESLRLQHAQKAQKISLEEMVLRDLGFGKERPAPKPRAWLVRSLFIAILVLPPVWWWWNTRGRRRSHNTTP